MCEDVKLPCLCFNGIDLCVFERELRAVRKVQGFIVIVYYSI